MKRLIAIALAALILASGLLAAPATRSTAKVPTSQPTTAPVRVTPEFAADFNEHLLNAKFNDVIAKLRELGALGGEPKRIGDNKEPYRLDLGYSWEYATYTFYVDDKGLISKYEFRPTHWPQPPGSDVSRHPENKLQAGNKWWLAHRFAKPVPGSGDGRETLMLIQAASPNAAAAKMVEQLAKGDKQSEKMMEKLGKPYLLAAVKLEEVEVHEWFTPRLTGQHGDR